MAFSKALSFGQSLRKMRKASGLSQGELGSRLGVTQQTIGKWENERAFPETENLEKLQEVLGTFWLPDQQLKPREAARLGTVMVHQYTAQENDRPAYDSLIEENLAARLPDRLRGAYQGAEARDMRVDYASDNVVIEFKWLGKTLNAPAIDLIRSVFWKLSRIRDRDTKDRAYYLIAVTDTSLQYNLDWHQDSLEALQEAVDGGFHLLFVNDSVALPALVEQIDRPH